MERQFSDIILLDNAQQYNDLLEGKSVTLASGTVLTELDKNAEYKVPASMLTRYHIVMTYSTNNEMYEFDVYSTNSDLFAGATTDSAKYAILAALYTGQTIPVTVIKDGTAFGCVIMTLLTDAFAVLGGATRIDGSAVLINTSPSTLDGITINYTKTSV